MARMNLGPELQALVDRARAEAREQGELPGRPWSASLDSLPPEARAALIDWVDSGDYDRAVAEVVADDPEELRNVLDAHGLDPRFVDEEIRAMA